MIRTFGAYPSFATIMIEFAVRNETSILPLLRPLYPIRGSLVHFQCEIPHPAHNVQKNAGTVADTCALFAYRGIIITL